MENVFADHINELCSECFLTKKDYEFFTKNFQEIRNIFDKYLQLYCDKISL